MQSNTLQLIYLSQFSWLSAIGLGAAYYGMLVIVLFCRGEQLGRNRASVTGQ